MIEEIVNGNTETKCVKKNCEVEEKKFGLV